jgi:hypothetical protein
MSSGESPSIKVRLPAGMLSAVDQAAAVFGCERSEAVRLLIYGGLQAWAVDPGQIGTVAVEMRQAWATARRLAD